MAYSKKKRSSKNHSSSRKKGGVKTPRTRKSARIESAHRKSRKSARSIGQIRAQKTIREINKNLSKISEEDIENIVYHDDIKPEDKLHILEDYRKKIMNEEPITRQDSESKAMRLAYIDELSNSSFSPDSKNSSFSP